MDGPGARRDRVPGGDLPLVSCAGGFPVGRIPLPGLPPQFPHAAPAGASPRTAYAILHMDSGVYPWWNLQSAANNATLMPLVSD